MSIIVDDIYTHYIEGEQVFPGGEWEIVHRFPEGCIFSRREFSGTLTFGDIRFNGISDDYAYIMGFGEQYCQRLSYEIYCNNELYWEGYLYHTLSYDVDEDNCTIKTTPLLLDEYDCMVLNGDIEYPIVGIGGSNVKVYDRDTGHCPYTVDGTIPSCLKLNDVVWYFVNNASYMNCDPGLSIVSSFFWLDDYPDGTTPTENYVMGAANVWDEIFIASINKARDEFGSTESGTDWPDGLSFNQLMGMLRDFFNCYWYIDENGDFRIEHLHYFENDFADRDHTDLPDDIDLTAINNEYTGKSVSIFKNKWKYLESELPSQEVLTMAASDGEDFVGLPIYYDIDCTYNYPTINIREYDQNQFMTDVQMLVDDPDSVSINGFLVLCAIETDIHEDTNLLTGWTNNAPPDDWDTAFTPNGANIETAIHAGTPPIGIAYSNNIGASAIGDQYTLCYYIPNVGFAGTPTMRIYNGTGAGAAAISNATGLVSGAWTQITFTILANAANSYVHLRTIAGGGDSLGNGIGDPAIFYLDDYSVEWYVVWEEGAISGNWCNNGHLSTANLMDNYWRHGRILGEGNMNDSDEVFDSVNPNRLQVPIIIPKCCERIHWGQYYETGLGTGKIYKAAEKKYTHEVELLYK